MKTCGADVLGLPTPMETHLLAVKQAAFRDGAKAERERILKMLREPSDELKEIVQRAICKGCGHNPDEDWSERDRYVEPAWTTFDGERHQALIAIADAIEADPT